MTEKTEITPVPVASAKLQDLPQSVIDEINTELIIAETHIEHTLEILREQGIEIDPRNISADEITDKDLAYINKGSDAIACVKLSTSDMKSTIDD